MEFIKGYKYYTEEEAIFARKTCADYYGLALTSTGTDSSSTTIGSLFRFSSSGNTTGYFQEVILWNVNYDSNRSGIEQNINNYYVFY